MILQQDKLTGDRQIGPTLRTEHTSAGWSFSETKEEGTGFILTEFTLISVLFKDTAFLMLPTAEIQRVRSPVIWPQQPSAAGGQPPGVGKEKVAWKERPAFLPRIAPRGLGGLTVISPSSSSVLPLSTHCA